MALDKTTEAIAHFAGWFHLSAEQSRMRLEYDLFRHKQAEQKELEAREEKDLVVHHGFKLENYNPGLSYEPSSHQLTGDVRPMAGSIGITMPALVLTGPAEAPQFMLNYADGQSGGSINFVLDPPSSIVALTIQYARLSDNDSFGTTTPDQFIAPDYFNAVLTTLSDSAAELSPISIQVIPTAENAHDIASDLMAQIAQAIEAHSIGTQTTDLPDDDGAADGGAAAVTPAQNAMDGEGPVLSVSVIASEDANGLFINGESAEELPLWDDLQPTYFREKSAEETNDGTAADTGGKDTEGGIATYSSSVTTDDPTAHDFSKDFEADILIPEDIGSGHEIVAGANAMINFSGISSNWLDAGTIVVGGDWIELDVITQVNILVNHDAAPGGGNSGITESLASTVLNVARIEELSTEEAAARAESAAQETDGAENDPFTGGTPESKADEAINPTNTVTGAAATASDGVTVHNQDITTTPPAASGNKSLDEPTRHSEHSGGPVAAVVVSTSGSIVQINTAQQHSFATDNDTATIRFGESKLFLGMGENEILNSLTAVEAGFSYDLIIVSGNVINIDIVSQTNVLFDSDLVELAGVQGTSKSHSNESATPVSDHSSCTPAKAASFQSKTTSEQTGQTNHQRSTETAETTTQSVSETSNKAVSESTSESVTGKSEMSVSSVQSTSNETSVANATTGSVQQSLGTATGSTSGGKVASQDASGKPLGSDTNESGTTAAGNQERELDDIGSEQSLQARSDKGEGTHESTHRNDQGGTSAEMTHTKGMDGNHGAAAHVNAHSVASGTPDEGGAPAPGAKKSPASEEGPGKSDLNANAPSEKHGGDDAKAEQFCDEPDDSAPAISTGDNLLYNEALLTKVGKDTEADMTGGFLSALDDLGKDPETAPQHLENEAVFDKVELLKILYIDGDFVKINKLDQINVLGDADRISVLGEDSAKGMGGHITATTGSNSLANFASIKETGVDSHVMVKGKSYSDALIHQAGFVDEKAVPDGVSIQALANEAVAFLADGMIDQNPASDLMKATDTHELDTGPPADILQSVLS